MSLLTPCTQTTQLNDNAEGGDDRGGAPSHPRQHATAQTRNIASATCAHQARTSEWTRLKCTPVISRRPYTHQRLVKFPSVDGMLPESRFSDALKCLCCARSRPPSRDHNEMCARKSWD
jgi:hypothetical protein